MRGKRERIQVLEGEKGCGRQLAPGRWWGWCGETDMGQTAPALCVECGGDYELAETDKEDQR